MKQKTRKFLHTFFKIFIIFMLGVMVINLLLFIGLTINHKSKLKKESKYLNAPGQYVEVEDYEVHAMVGGDEDAKRTLVFIHSDDTIDGSISLQPLFKELKDCRYVYIDRSGYGFTEENGSDKDIDALLKEQRETLKALGIEGPYTLVPLGSAGTIAFYWAHTFPAEVEDIIGINMNYPDQYIEMSTAEYVSFFDYLLVKFCKIGGHRLLKKAYSFDDYGIYTDEQVNTRKALFGKYFYTEDRYNEESKTVDNAKEVAKLGVPLGVPIYLIYNNPFMQPYRDQDEEVKEGYEELVEADPEGDYISYYNEDFRDYFSKYENVKIKDMQGPSRLYEYAPKELAQIINDYMN